MNFKHGNIDALKRYKSTEVDRRFWLHVPSGTPWSSSSDTHQVVEIKKNKKNKNIISAISIFVNIRVPGDSSESAFQLLVGNGCVKGRKINGRHACDMVEIWRLKMF